MPIESAISCNDGVNPLTFINTLIILKHSACLSVNPLTFSFFFLTFFTGIGLFIRSSANSNMSLLFRRIYTPGCLNTNSCFQFT